MEFQRSSSPASDPEPCQRPTYRPHGPLLRNLSQLITPVLGTTRCSEYLVQGQASEVDNRYPNYFACGELRDSGLMSSRTLAEAVCYADFRCSRRNVYLYSTCECYDVYSTERKQPTYSMQTAWELQLQEQAKQVNTCSVCSPPVTPRAR